MEEYSGKKIYIWLRLGELLCQDLKTGIQVMVIATSALS